MKWRREKQYLVLCKHHIHFQVETRDVAAPFWPHSPARLSACGSCVFSPSRDNTSAGSMNEAFFGGAAGWKRLDYPRKRGTSYSTASLPTADKSFLCPQLCSPCKIALAADQSKKAAHSSACPPRATNTHTLDSEGPGPLSEIALLLCYLQNMQPLTPR